MGDRIRTHWEDCWKASDHHECAIVQIESLRAQVQSLKAEIERLKRTTICLVCQRKATMTIGRSA